MDDNSNIKIKTKINKSNSILIYLIYIFLIALSVMYLLWVYYGARAYQCTVTNNPKCQRLVCEDYELSKSFTGLNSQPDPQNQYATSLFYTISMQSILADPKENGYENGYCDDCNKDQSLTCIDNVTCYAPNSVVVDGEDKNSNAPFKRLTVNVNHNNLLKQAEYMCSKILENATENPDLISDCELYKNNPEILKNNVLNKKLIENLNILTNFNYYRLKPENLNLTNVDSTNIVNNQFNSVLIPTCISNLCEVIYGSNYSNIEYGPNRDRLKAKDFCSKCDDPSTIDQFKMFLPNPNIQNVNAEQFKLLPFDFKMLQIKFLED